MAGRGRSRARGGWFGERLPLDEPGLIAALAVEPSPERRAPAAHSLLQLPSASADAWAALAEAMTGDVSATVRATAIIVREARLAVLGHQR